MSTFSERFAGLGPRPIQLTGMDDELRNGLWNAVHLHYFVPRLHPISAGHSSAEPVLRDFMVAIWNDVLKIRVDSMGVLWRDMVTPVRDHFNVATWNGVYDFVEFLTDWFPDNEVHRSNKKFIAECNRVLQRELSAYRFIGKQLVRLTTADEIAAVEEARERREPAAVVSDHLDAALRFMSDRDAPNFRNSIKESISAVESCCSLLAGTTKADLNGALQVLEKRTKLHPALKRAFSALYGYTSDADGVRHALLEESTLSFDDAKFMLVSCSAFINYVRAIAS